MSTAPQYLAPDTNTLKYLEQLASYALKYQYPRIVQLAYEQIIDIRVPVSSQPGSVAPLLTHKEAGQAKQHAHQQLAHLYLSGDAYTKIDVAAGHRHFNAARTTFTYPVKHDQAKIIRADPLFSAPTLIALWVAMFHQRQPIQDYLLHLFKTTLGYPECQTLSELRQRIKQQRISTSCKTDDPFYLLFAESMLGIFSTHESYPTKYLDLLLTAQRRSAHAQIIYVFVAAQYERFDNLFKHTADALCSLLHPKTTHNSVLRATLTLYYTRALDVVPDGFPVKETHKLLDWIKTHPDEAPRFYPQVNCNITPKTDQPTSAETIAAQRALNELLIVPAVEDPGEQARLAPNP